MKSLMMTDTKILTADGHIKFRRGTEYLEASRLSMKCRDKGRRLQQRQRPARPGLF